MDVRPRIFLCDLTYTQQTVASDVMPAAVGGIAAYLLQEIPAVDVKLFKYPEGLISTLESLKPENAPHLVGFSNYVWNCNLSLSFARAIKDRFPSVVIVFGGPNLAYDSAEQEQFLRHNPVIDFHVVKEGETAFCNLVRTLIANGWDLASVSEKEINNLVFIDNGGRFRSRRWCSPIREIGTSSLAQRALVVSTSFIELRGAVTVFRYTSLWQ
jgi:B12 binding domain